MKVTTRALAGGAAAAIVLIGAGGWVLGVQPQLAHADETDASTASIEAQIATTQAKVARLSTAAAKQSDLEAQDVVLTKAVPGTLQANTFIRRMNTVAAIDGVDVDSVTIGAAAAYTSPAGTTAAAAPAATPVATPSASASTDTATTAAAVPTTPLTAATDPLITPANLTVIPVTVVVKGTADAGRQFVKDVQRDERLYLVSGVSTAADGESSGSVTTTLEGSVYALNQ